MFLWLLMGLTDPKFYTWLPKRTPSKRDGSRLNGFSGICGLKCLYEFGAKGGFTGRKISASYHWSRPSYGNWTHEPINLRRCRWGYFGQSSQGKLHLVSLRK